MREIDKARFKDSILKYLVDNDSSCNNEHIAKDLFKDKIGKGTVRKLCFEINDYDKHILRIVDEGNFVIAIPNDYTKVFLEKGGFSQIYKDDTYESERLKKRTIKKERREAVLDNLKIFGIILSIPISICSLIISLKESPLDKRFDGINKKVEDFEHRLIRENDSLRNRLYEANLLLKTYEGDVN